MIVEIDKGRGLCMTCNNAPGCFHRARRGPALFCETFDDYVAPKARIGDRVTGPCVPTAVAAEQEEVSKYKGLCVNCDHRRTCRHPKPAGGVWHCEDYR